MCQGQQKGKDAKGRTDEDWTQKGKKKEKRKNKNKNKNKKAKRLG